MFTRVEIKSFRTCRDVVLDNIGPVLALVGRNSAGKTNVLKAIRWISRQATLGVREHREGREEGASDSVTIEVLVDEIHYRYQLAYRRIRPKDAEKSFKKKVTELLAIKTKQQADFESVFTRTNQKVILFRTVAGLPEVSSDAVTEIMVQFAPAFLSLLAIHSENDPILSPLLRFLRCVRYLPLIELDDSDEPQVVPIDDFKAWEDDYSATHAIPDSEGVIKTLIHLHNNTSPVFDEVVQLLGPKGLDVIDNIVVRKIGTEPEKGVELKQFYTVHFAMPGTRRLRRFDQLSLGTRRVIRLILQLTDEFNSALLLEHPEDGIHRGLLTKLMDVIKTNADPLQVFLTSHSPYVLNAVGAENIRLVFCDNGITRSRSLNDKELEAAGSYLEHEGTLSDFIELITEDGQYGEHGGA